MKITQFKINTITNPVTGRKKLKEFNTSGKYKQNTSLEKPPSNLPKTIVTPKKPSGHETLACRNHRATKITTKMANQTFGGALSKQTGRQVDG